VSWFGQSRRHALARKGIKTYRTKDRHSKYHTRARLWASESGKPTRDYVDSLAYPSVEKINKLGVKTMFSCEGHDDEPEEYHSKGSKFSEPYIYMNYDKDVKDALDRAGWYTTQDFRYGYGRGKLVHEDDEMSAYYNKPIKTEEELKSIWKKTERELDKI